MQIQGSVLVFPRLCLLWHVKALEVRPARPPAPPPPRADRPRPGQDVGDDSLAALTVYHPRPGAPQGLCPPPPLAKGACGAEHFILGVGESTPALPPGILDYCRRHGISVEAMSRVRVPSPPSPVPGR